MSQFKEKNLVLAVFVGANPSSLRARMKWFSAIFFFFPFFPVTEPKGANRDGASPAINKGGAQPPLGGLFAGGFPVLRPAGQRDLPGKGFICMKEQLG